MKTLFVYLSFTLFSLFACKTEEETPLNENVISCTIDGIKWADNDILKALKVGENISFGGSSDPYTVGLTIPLSCTAGNTYTVSAGASKRLSSSTLIQYQTTKAQVTITEKSENTIEGTFMFVATSPAGETLTIKEGQFSVQY